MPYRLASRICGALMLLGLLSLSFGCGGPNYKARGTVKGKVTYNGKSLTTGTVMFYGAYNLTGSASIDKNGNYVMKDAPIGDVKVTVTVAKLSEMGGPGMGPASGMGKDAATPASKMTTGPGGTASKDLKSVNPNNPGQSISIMGEMPKQIVAIPDKYSKPEESGLTYKVEKGEHTFDIPLK